MGLETLLLLFQLLVAVRAHVEVPTNVTLHCHNRQNIVKWNYNQILPGLQFKVIIRQYSGDPVVLMVGPSDLQADISNFSDPKNDYYVDVRAVIGDNESESAPPEGIIYSYFKDSTAAQKCSVDLPSVNVTAKADGHIMFGFTHPWLWHHPNPPSNSKRKKKSYDAQHGRGIPEFKYDVVVISQEKHPHSFRCVERVCQQTLSVDLEPKKHCLNITGEMEKIAVKSTQLYCTMPLVEAPPAQNNYIYVVMVALTLSAFAFVIFLVYLKKTRPSTATPRAITISKETNGTAGTAQEEIAVPHVEPSSPTPLLMYPEEDEFTTVLPPDEPELRLRLGVSTKEEDVSDVAEVEHSDYEGHGYIKGSNLEEDESSDFSEAPSGYEKRQVLVELGQDDIATGYRGS